MRILGKLVSPYLLGNQSTVAEKISLTGKFQKILRNPLNDHSWLALISLLENESKVGEKTFYKGKF